MTREPDDPSTAFVGRWLLLAIIAVGLAFVVVIQRLY